MKCPNCNNTPAVLIDGECWECANNREDGAARQDGAELGAAHGWTALIEEVERREGEARRELKYAQSVDAKNCEAYQRGKIAALTDLANWIADTKEVPPIERTEAQPPENQKR